MKTQRYLVAVSRAFFSISLLLSFATLAVGQRTFQIFGECGHGCERPHTTAITLIYGGGFAITADDEAAIRVIKSNRTVTNEFLLQEGRRFVNRVDETAVNSQLNSILLKVWDIHPYCKDHDIIRGNYSETGRFATLAELRRSLGLDIPPIAPRGTRPNNTLTTTDDGFRTFYSKFRRAVRANDRAVVRSMMSLVFLVALGDEESPDQALRFWSTKEWQQLRMAVNRSPVAGPRGYHLSDRHLGTLVFILENGKWKWKGLQGD